jgi:hypothetical protein
VLRARLLLIVALAFAIPSVCRAASTKQACLTAHAEAQRSRMAKDFAAAKAQLLVCNQDSCPGPVAEDCARWLSELLGEQPTVVFVARDAQGQDTPEVRVWMDGALLLERLDGHAVEVNPGEHRFRFEWPGGQSTESRVVMHAGEKARRLEAAAPAAALTQPVALPAADEGLPTAAWVLWGGGVVAGGAFAVLAISGRSRESELARTCAGHCAADDVSGLRRQYVAADISLVAALAAASAGAIVALWPTFTKDDTLSVRVGPAGADATLRF